MFQVTLYLSSKEFEYMRKGENFGGTLAPIDGENFIPVLVDAERLKYVPLTPTQVIQVYGRNQF